MKIARIYSHLNGLEFLEARQPALWNEIQAVIASVDASKCKTKVSKERGKVGKMLFSPKDLNSAYDAGFEKRKWKEAKAAYYVCEDASVNRRNIGLTLAEQKAEIVANNLRPLYSYNQTDFVKNKVAVEVQFGKYSFVAYDLFVKHLAFYVAEIIDVGVEIVPMKSLQAEMSSGPAYYEGELYNLVREGRGVPPVPLIMIGVET